MESESSRAEMIGDFMAMFHLLRITGILSAQVSQCHGSPKRPEGEATMRDRPPRREALPISCHELLRKAQEKINKLAASVIEPRDFTPEEIAARPPYTSNDAGEADEDDEDPWAAVGPSENEGASVGKAKASHAAPQKASVAKPAAKDPAPPKAASTGAPPSRKC
jgi:hypothetical protein